MAGKSKFYVEATNSKGKKVRTGTGSQMGRATLYAQPTSKNEESFSEDSVQVTITQTKDETLLIAISPRLLMRKYKIILQSGALAEILVDRIVR